MSASFPTSVKSFTTKLAGDTINAAHVNDIQDEIVALEQDLVNGLSRLRLGSSTLTIASDAVTATKSLHAVDTESAAATDVLSTITAGTGVGAGHLLTLYAANAARVVTVTDATGNIQLYGGSYALDSAKKSILLRYDGTNWVEIARAGSASSPFETFTAASNRPPASAAATLDTRNAHAVLDFDGATDEEAVFESVLSLGYSGRGLTVEVYCAFTSATSGSVRWQAGIERIDASSLDIDADSFASFQSAGGTAPATSGMVIKVAVVFTAGAQMDSLAAGEAYRLKIRRDADGTSGTDDIATDAELLRVVLRET